MELNAPHLLIGTRRLELRQREEQHATPPLARAARMFPTRLDGGPEEPRGTMHLGTAHPSQYGTGALIDLISDDPDWWDQVAAAAAKTAKDLRALHAEHGSEPSTGA